MLIFSTLPIPEDPRGFDITAGRFEQHNTIFNKNEL
jgi:hypothetical protein